MSMDGRPPVSAQSIGCIDALMAASMEFAPLPDGYAWTELAIETDGSWRGDIARAAEVEDVGPRAGVILTCVPNPQLFMKRMAEVELVGRQRVKVGVIPIGDESYASRAESPPMVLYWRHGEILGQVWAWYSLSSPDKIFEIGELEAIAQALDGALPM